MTIGQRGMVVAAKAIALTAADLFGDPTLVKAAQAEFAAKKQGNAYRSLIPEGQGPPLEYRKN